MYELQRRQLPPRSDAEKKAGVASATGLHAKTFQIDGKAVFVGSFNFDPRSAKVNTEMGLVIDSTVLAKAIRSFFDTAVSSMAYEVRLDPDDGLQWMEATAEGPRMHDREPGTSVWRRAEARFYSVLPIEGLL